MKALAYRIVYAAGRPTLPLTPPIMDRAHADRERARIATLLDCDPRELAVVQAAAPADTTLPEEDSE